MGQKGFFIMENNKINVTREVTNNINYKDFARKKVSVCGELIAIKATKSYRSEPSIKKIDKDRYVVLSTGEIRYFNKNEETTPDSNKFKDRLEMLKLIINSNFNGTPNERFITLTYKEPMFDTKELICDFDKFWRRFKRRYPNCKFIRICEPHRNGSWHFHILLKDIANEELVIDEEKLLKIWKNGSVNIKPINDVYGLSLYFFPSFDKNGKGKAKEKFKRLKFYPKGFNVYSKSREIANPVWEIVSTEQIQEITKDCKLTYSATYEITSFDDDGKQSLVNLIAKQQYKRNKNQKTLNSKPELLNDGKEG